ncbi:hypothetical protein Cni_G00300 [Canna indica]|uniref:Serine-rich protein n=1 Tax=Canna indica TaxID=4628 RepID=A0AAQ3JKS1_9LILI|nr:hypothetical protein Cni_G00300 [Canna indica]
MASIWPSRARSTGSSVSSSSSSSSSSSRTCLCAPTTHPGSFRCSLHRSTRNKISNRPAAVKSPELMTIKGGGGGGGAKVKSSSVRAVLLKMMISPSSRGLRRRKNFQPTPSRFRLMNCAESCG